MFDFDPEEFVYEVSDALAPVDPDATFYGDDPIEEPGPAFEIESASVSEAEISESEKRRLRNKKERERKARNKKRIDGIDISSIVLIKRQDDEFYSVIR